MPSPRHVDELKHLIGEGRSFGLVLFFEPEPAEIGVLGSECLSQWYPAPMQLDGERFATAEHYMMWRKARLFGDSEVERQLLADGDPAVAKHLGRRVRNFRSDVWDRLRLDVVIQGSIAKFEQHATLRNYLLQTGTAILAEASPVDNIWGIGFGATDPHARNPLMWTGRNLLGFALMQARERLAR